MYTELPEGVTRIIGALGRCGFEAYAVGGCVRDSLIGCEPHDWDICTDAPPEEVMRIFPHTVPAGLKHGTVTVLDGGGMYEVTTYRIDGEYSDSRRPDSVSFTKSLYEDLKRRDFTINAMAYSPRSGLVDICGGAEDLKNGIIRCVGAPDRRFSEDALRVLRAWRFVCVLGFEFEEKTLDAAVRHTEKLGSVSAERVRDELVKALGNGRGLARAELGGCGFLRYVIPEWQTMDIPQNNPHHIYTVREHSLRTLASLGTDCDVITKLAALLHDIGKPRCYTEDADGTGHFYGHAKISADITDRIMKRLRFSTDMRGLVTELVLYHDAFVDDTQKSVKRWLNRIGEYQLRRLIAVKKADASAQNPAYTAQRLEKAERITAAIDEVLAKNECFSMKELAVGGRDLLAVGYEPSPALGNALKMLLDGVISGELENSRDVLMKKAEEYKKDCGL